MTGADERRRLRLEPGWAGPLITAAAAGAYLLGYLETAFFASALGVTARDLGIDVKDYAVLALVNVVVVALAALFLWVALECHPKNPGLEAWLAADPARAKRRRRLAHAGYWGGFITAVVVGALGFRLEPGQGVATLPVTAAACFGVLLARQGRMVAAGIAAAFAAVGLLAVACFSADAYAGRLLDATRDARTAPMPPLALRSILQPEVGVATHGTATTCAVRVSPHVLLGRTATTVVTPDRFTVRPCDLADVPFG